MTLISKLKNKDFKKKKKTKNFKRKKHFLFSFKLYISLLRLTPPPPTTFWEGESDFDP